MASSSECGEAPEGFYEYFDACESNLTTPGGSDRVVHLKILTDTYGKSFINVSSSNASLVIGDGETYNVVHLRVTF